MCSSLNNYQTLTVCPKYTFYIICITPTRPQLYNIKTMFILFIFKIKYYNSSNEFILFRTGLALMLCSEVMCKKIT